MEYYGKVLCVTIKELTEGNEKSPAIMTISNYSIMVNRDKINVIRRACINNHALIEYDSLPEKYKHRFVDKYGDPHELEKERFAHPLFKIDTEARKFYFSERLKNGESIPDRIQEEYVINASVLNLLLHYYMEQQRLRRALNNSTRINFGAIYEVSETLRSLHKHTLPKSMPRLRLKMFEYKEKGYNCLISGKFANVNTLKITEKAGAQIIALKRSQVPVYTNEQIFDKYNQIASHKGWKPLQSKTTLISFLEDPKNKVKWADAVYGELYARNLYQRKHKTELPTMRDALWYGDGTKLNLYYKEYIDGKTVMKTAQVYEVIDAYSEMLLGCCIANTENSKMQYQAYRKAIEYSQNKPYEIVYDNQGGHKTKENQALFDKICHFHRPTAPHNASSKTIESLFGRFQTQVLHQYFGFTGQNICAKKDSSRANMEFVLANIENLYTYDEMVAAYAAYRHEWNAMPHYKTGIVRSLMYENSINPEAERVNDIDIINMFWLVTEKPSKFTANGITIQIDKKEYTYEVFDSNGMPDLEFRQRHTGREFFVKYDPQDMTHVILCTSDKNGLRNVIEARPYRTVHRAVQEQADGDMAFIRAMDKLNKQQRLKNQIAAAVTEMEHGVAPEQHGLNTPRLQGISLKEVERLSDELHNEPAAINLLTVAAFHKQLSNQEYDALDILRKS